MQSTDVNALYYMMIAFDFPYNKVLISVNTWLLGEELKSCLWSIIRL